MKKKQVRKKFRDAVFERDRYTCQGCGIRGTEETLDAHHIIDRNEMPDGGYLLDNGITLCKDKCHRKAEMFHETQGKEYVVGFHPLDLKKKIGLLKCEVPL